MPINQINKALEDSKRIKDWRELFPSIKYRINYDNIDTDITQLIHAVECVAEYSEFFYYEFLEIHEKYAIIIAYYN